MIRKTKKIQLLLFISVLLLTTACSNECSSLSGGELNYQSIDIDEVNFSPQIFSNPYVNSDTISVLRAREIDLLEDLPGEYDYTTNELNHQKVSIKLNYVSVQELFPVKITEVMDSIYLMYGPETNKESNHILKFHHLIAAKRIFTSEDVGSGSLFKGYELELTEAFKSANYLNAQLRDPSVRKHNFYFVGFSNTFPIYNLKMGYQLSFDYTLEYNGPCKYKPE